MTCLPQFFIEIGSCLTDREQKSWHVFSPRHGVDRTNISSMSSHWSTVTYVCLSISNVSLSVRSRFVWLYESSFQLVARRWRSTRPSSIQWTRPSFYDTHIHALSAVPLSVFCIINDSGDTACTVTSIRFSHWCEFATSAWASLTQFWTDC